MRADGRRARHREHPSSTPRVPLRVSAPRVSTLESCVRARVNTCASICVPVWIYAHADSDFRFPIRRHSTDTYADRSQDGPKAERTGPAVHARAHAGRCGAGPTREARPTPADRPAGRPPCDARMGPTATHRLRHIPPSTPATTPTRANGTCGLGFGLKAVGSVGDDTATLPVRQPLGAIHTHVCI